MLMNAVFAITSRFPKKLYFTVDKECTSCRDRKEMGRLYMLS